MSAGFGPLGATPEGSKMKPAGWKDKLRGVIDTLISAVRAGELDDHFAQASKQRVMPTARK